MPLLLSLVRELAEFEKLQVTASETDLHAALFGRKTTVEAYLLESKTSTATVCTDGTSARGQSAPPLLSVKGCEVLGYSLIYYNFSSFVGKPGIYIEDIYVRERYRGCGYGTLLLTHIARKAASEGVGRLEWAVLDWNQSAQDFYRKMGASILPDWRICRLTAEQLEARYR
eukprot:jgi/Chrzof1/8737/Cz03g22150.t1